MNAPDITRVCSPSTIVLLYGKQLHSVYENILPGWGSRSTTRTSTCSCLDINLHNAIMHMISGLLECRDFDLAVHRAHKLIKNVLTVRPPLRQICILAQSQKPTRGISYVDAEHYARFSFGFNLGLECFRCPAGALSIDTLSSSGGTRCVWSISILSFPPAIDLANICYLARIDRASPTRVCPDDYSRFAIQGN